MNAQIWRKKEECSTKRRPRRLYWSIWIVWEYKIRFRSIFKRIWERRLVLRMILRVKPVKLIFEFPVNIKNSEYKESSTTKSEPTSCESITKRAKNGTKRKRTSTWTPAWSPKKDWPLSISLFKLPKTQIANPFYTGQRSSTTPASWPNPTASWKCLKRCKSTWRTHMLDGSLPCVWNGDWPTLHSQVAFIKTRCTSRVLIRSFRNGSSSISKLCTLERWASKTAIALRFWVLLTITT